MRIAELVEGLVRSVHVVSGDSSCWQGLFQVSAKVSTCEKEAVSRRGCVSRRHGSCRFAAAATTQRQVNDIIKSLSAVDRECRNVV